MLNEPLNLEPRRCCKCGNRIPKPGIRSVTLSNPFQRPHTVPTITIDDIIMLQAISGQAVLSTASIQGIRETQKTQLAEELTGSILEEIGLELPETLVQIAVQAAQYSLSQSSLREQSI